jgi:hypothetical protein
MELKRVRSRVYTSVTQFLKTSCAVPRVAKTAALGLEDPDNSGRAKRTDGRVICSSSRPSTNGKIRYWSRETRQDCRLKLWVLSLNSSPKSEELAMHIQNLNRLRRGSPHGKDWSGIPVGL